MIGTHNLRVLVVDDTIVYRKAVSDILRDIPGVEVVGVAHNGVIAMTKIKTLKPDLLTLDIEMPQMNGIEVLEELNKHHPGVGAIMLSTLTMEGGTLTLRALELGAFDFIPKPQAGSVKEGMAEIRKAIIPMLQAYKRKSRKIPPSAKSTTGRRTCRSGIAQPDEDLNISGILRGQNSAFENNSVAFGRNSPRNSPATSSRTSSAPAATTSVYGRKVTRGKSEIVAIGISTGGPNALSQMLPQLPGDLGVPVVIVQHMPPIFTQSLATSLNKRCALTVKEAEEGEDIKPNVIYIAPGGKQMKLVAGRDGTTRRIRITDDPPENSCKPSVDYLFRSVADYYVGRTTAVIMTGMGSDGTAGLAVLKEKAAYIIGQNEQSCVVYGMPRAPAERGYLDRVLPLHKIADQIVRSVRSPL
jgi:two-component system chemotaxis response regulator CheB